MQVRHIFSRITLLCLASLLAPISHLAAQQSSAKASPLPAYDAVAIHQNRSGSYGISLHLENTSLVATNIDLANLVSNAYNIRPALISGFPKWTNSARFDINAKVTDPDVISLYNLTEDQRRLMLLALLSDRFHLRTHFEQKILPVYDLVVTKDGPKFKEHPAVPPQGSGEQHPSSRSIKFGNSEMTAISIGMQNLVWNLSYRVGRPVIDKTNLTHTYDFHLKWRSDEQEQAGVDTDAPDIFTALQEQLGLRLEPSKGPVQTLVIDHVEMPSEN